MFSDKSAKLIEVYTNIWNKRLIVALKPRLDKRDGAYIKSKKYPHIKIPARSIETIEEIKDIIINEGFKTVLIDEAEFLTGDVRDLIDLSVILGIDFYIAGLNMTSELEPFGIMADILAVSDEIMHVRGYCQDCNKPAYYSYSLNADKIQRIEVGDNYISLCPDCYKRRTLKQSGKYLTLWRIE